MENSEIAREIKVHNLSISGVLPTTVSFNPVPLADEYLHIFTYSIVTAEPSLFASLSGRSE
jgi:hypothetical protein